MPVDKISIASSSGLLAGLLPPATSAEEFNGATQLKLGQPVMLDKLKEEVLRVVREEDEAVNGAPDTPGDSTVNGHANGTDANGDVEMGDARSPNKQVKLEPEADPDVVAPEPTETLPPQPTFYKVTDVKREVEAVRDKRKMIRLGPPGEGTGAPATLPSIVAFTMFDGGENVTSVEFSPDSSLIAAGSAESTVRLWSLRDEKLRAKSLGEPWCGGADGRRVGKRGGGRGDGDAQARRALGASVRPKFRSDFRLRRAAACPPLVVSGRDGAPLVDGHVLQPRGVPGPRARAGVGRRVGSVRRVLRHGKPRPYGAPVELGPVDPVKDVHRPSGGRERESAPYVN